jgi:hypothetical protein
LPIFGQVDQAVRNVNGLAHHAERHPRFRAYVADDDVALVNAYAQPQGHAELSQPLAAQFVKAALHFNSRA